MPPERMMPRPEPLHVNTHGKNYHAFEAYTESFEAELKDENYEGVREEIGAHYDIPKDHRYFISDEQFGNKKKRTQRAFTVVILDSGERYYIDGRTAHIVLLQTLLDEHGVKMDFDTENFTSINGFIDPNGFQDIADVQKRTEELHHPITWFVRYKVPSSTSSPVPESPIEIS